MLDMPFELAHRIVALALKFHKVSLQQKNITPSKIVFFHLPRCCGRSTPTAGTSSAS
jgi:hypothetical protein